MQYRFWYFSQVIAVYGGVLSVYSKYRAHTRYRVTEWEGVHVLEKD